MGNPRGASFYRIHAYEYSLLMELIPETSISEDVRKLQVYTDLLDNDDRVQMQRQCGFVSDMIKKHCGGLTDAAVSVKRSRRGRNYTDCTVSGRDGRFGIEVKTARNRTGSDLTEYQMQYDTLISLLLQRLPDRKCPGIAKRWNCLKNTLEKGRKDGLEWNNNNLLSSVMLPARELLNDTAAMLHGHGTGLLPALWDHYYGMPVWRTVFTENNAFVTYIDVEKICRDNVYSLAYTEAEAGLQEMSGDSGIRLRVHSSSRKVSASSLVVGTTFVMPSAGSSVHA